VTPSTTPRITARNASDIMTWSVLVDIAREGGAVLAHSLLSRNLKNAKT
jgi:hypothetical protein